MKSEKQLYQWDVNQYLTELQPEAQFVDYPMGNEVIRIETDGKRCRIPDEFLQTAGFKTCYERYSDGTYKAYSFNVQSSPKPPDYVYTAEERTTFEALVEKTDAAIDEIKRRADSGEFTPVKGVDYFTEKEKTEMMESVSDGAIGEFRKVVDSATTELSDNHNLQLAKYNANAAEKLTTYDTNDEQRTSDYNRNAEVKLEAYNSNHAAKVAEYNANAETKTAEFDANAAALQTEVDRLRGECDNLAAENRKQENKISALIKLNKGQTYDIVPEEGETASRTAPSGAKYVGIDKVGGKSVVWNQLFNMSQNNRVDGGQFEINFESQTVTLNGNSGNNAWLSIIPDDGAFAALNVKNHQYIYKISVVENQSAEDIRFGFLNRGFVANIPANYTGRVNFLCTVSDPEKGKSIGFSGLQPNTDYAVRLVLSACDLTLMFGAGHEPTAEQFEAMFPEVSYPYNSGEIVSGTTANVELEGKNLWDDSDPAFTKVLTKAGFTFDGTVWKSELIDYIATPIAITKGSTFSYDINSSEGSNARFKFAMNSGNLIYRPHESDGSWKHHSVYLPDDVHTIYIDYTQRASCEIKNIQLERGTVETSYSPHTKQSITTGFPELRSALAAHDYIDMDGEKVHRKIKKTRIDGNTPIYSVRTDQDNCCRVVFTPETSPGIVISEEPTIPTNIISDKLATITHNNYWSANAYTGIEAYPGYASISMRLQDRTDLDTKEKVSAWLADNPTTVYYETESDELTDVTIPEALTEWLPVEPGGTVTFRNSDESKQLAVPNGVSWVRKLNEVE